MVADSASLFHHQQPAVGRLKSADFFQDKSVLVTGAAGFIGSHLVDWLLAVGAEVVGVDSFITGRAQNLAAAEDHPHFTLIEADVAQPVEQYLSSDQLQAGFDLVLHFASPASPPRYQDHPVTTYQANVWGCHHLLSFLKKQNPNARFVFASTSEVYGDPKVHPQPESYWGHVNPNGVRSCYDEAKRMGETICGVFERDLDLDVRIVRIFNTYGPRMDPADGRVIPNFATQALRKEPLTLYGDGSQTRSYCFVDDLVRGILDLAAVDDGSGQTINLGNPVELTVAQTAQYILAAVEDAAPHSAEELAELRSDQVRYHPLPADDPTRRQPDIQKAQRLLGWEPTVSFADGLTPTLAYFKELVLADNLA